ncbi:PREDICTED: 15-hydroxyprostaglandin dehydrogenase [NAD(+)]-like [Amphimedon queenslandica]|nr:PREDICTED: 15-hydroxyprostaglandin dehydrogenase [NAD(+)]-like [Amphimedon queenslandica]|eukprot:XP_011407270.2 PREDICTED: 15-hydroxyprostaglandin dehydrogenase [NAD(+)]-like [Amphimedon queenslandica]
MLFGRVAVVTLTGADRPTASDEIVLEASNLLLQSGAKVCLVDVFNGACSALKSRCDALEKKYGANNVGYISCDIMNDTDALRRAFKKAFEHFGSLDIVINNFYVYDEENLEKLLKINLQSVISGTYNAMELMSPDKGAVIVNVSSMAG